MSDRQLMRAVRAACEELVAELDALGWEFDNDEPLHPPGVVGLEHLEALQTWLTGPVPEVAIDFWLEVGGIDLSGEHPDWDEDGLTPLVIEAPVDDLLEAVAREAEDGPVKRLPVSPDFALSLPDAYVVGRAEALPFVDHLRIVLLEHGGITGFTGERPAELDAAAAALPRF